VQNTQSIAPGTVTLNYVISGTTSVSVPGTGNYSTPITDGVASIVIFGTTVNNGVNTVILVGSSRVKVRWISSVIVIVETDVI
jgi:hypothetical protein